MSATIGFCGYSYHTQRYYSQYRSGFPAYLFRLQTEGTCEAVVGERKMEIEKGDLVVVTPGDYYELLIKENETSADYHLICEGPWIEEWWNRSSIPAITRIDLDEKLLSLWRHLMIEVRRPRSGEEDELSGYLLRALCVSLERAVNERAPSYNQPYVVTRMMRFIEEHATSSLKVEMVAHHVDLSISRAVHLFKQHVGKTMIEYALEIRLAAAVERMKYTSLTLEQIAVDCGFGAYPYFHKIFKKKYGTSPGAYRRKE